jgi:hypothetical protein
MSIQRLVVACAAAFAALMSASYVVDSVIDPTNLPSLARAERTSVPRKN